MSAGTDHSNKDFVVRIWVPLVWRTVFPPWGFRATEKDATSGMLHDPRRGEDEDASPRFDVCFLGCWDVRAIHCGASCSRRSQPGIQGSGTAPFNWNGFYLGANVGGAWASNAVDQSNLVKNGNRDFKVTSSRVVGGGQFGYNLVAAPSWLLGVEADVSGADLNGAVTNPDSGVKFNEKIDAFGTVRGRVGYVVNNWLFYGIGGFAWSDDTFTRTQVAAGPNSPPTGDVRTNSPSRTGWAAGGGIEYGFAKNWTARVEYLHHDFGDQSFSFTASNGSFRGVDEGRLSVDSVRVGVSYLFN